MEQRFELGEFLQTRRARLRPDEVGLVSYGERRRVPGLRREELAQLAGVSVSYYTRLEQGQSQHASDEVLDAIARALRLDATERAHLTNLARPARTGRRGPVRTEQARPGVHRLIEAMTDVAAVVIGRRTDVLAWNALGHALFGGHLDRDAPNRPADRPNMTRLVFLDPHSRELYADWKGKACTSVSYLRLLAGRYPDDPALTSLIGELTVKSPEFAGLWAAHPVRYCPPDLREFNHPLVGRLVLAQEAMALLEDPDQLLSTFTAEPGSPSEAGLRLLGSLAAGSATDDSTSSRPVDSSRSPYRR
jgi:transcriptional regulator with XRE-family HTH domain